MSEDTNGSVCNGKVDRLSLTPASLLQSGPGKACLPVNTWGGLVGMSAWGKKKPGDFMIHKSKHQTCSQIH